jgi:hypothetical protein
MGPLIINLGDSSSSAVSIPSKESGDDNSSDGGMIHPLPCCIWYVLYMLF